MNVSVVCCYRIQARPNWVLVVFRKPFQFGNDVPALFFKGEKLFALHRCPETPSRPKSPMGAEKELRTHGEKGPSMGVGIFRFCHAEMRSVIRSGFITSPKNRKEVSDG